MSGIQKYIRERKSDRLFDDALELKSRGLFAEAAEVHMRRAELALNENALIYSANSRDAFEMWLKAGRVDKALEQARNSLKGYTMGDWLKGENRFIDELLKMVRKLYRTDHYDEADALFSEINEYLTSIGEDLVEVTVWRKGNKFPPECQNCGGQITYRGNRDETQCPFCKTLIGAIDQNKESIV